MAQPESRPTPEELLAVARAEEASAGRGKLKIFLGYAPGVGKTYAMLEAAHQRQGEPDIVVAYVDTHGRRDTEALLAGLEVMPRQAMEYRGITLSDMNLDAVLARHPRLAIVDELAHTNAPGMRHPKRHQDIEELLAAGIDVYTTINIQHIESLRNVVAQVTGVWVRETIPDSVIDQATELEMVDLPPDELIKRLNEGKVYVPEQIARATAEFFRRDNLTALRELALRTVAEHVDKAMRDYVSTQDIRGPWPTAERLLVCITPGALGSRMVRTARRLAFQLGAEWSAVYVEIPADSRLPADQQKRLQETMRLAEQLGAKTATVQGEAVADAVIDYAGKNNITKIVVGNPETARWRKALGRSTVSRIMRRSGNIDVYIVSGVSGEPAVIKKPPAPPAPFAWRGYLEALGLVLAATLVSYVLRPYFTPASLVMVYLTAIVVAAFRRGLGPSIMASVLGVIAFDVFMVPPYLSFTVADTQYILTFLVLLAVGVLISYLASRIRQHTEVTAHRERQTAALYALSRDLTLVNDLDSYVHAILKRTKETFGRESVIFLPDTENKAALRPFTEDAVSVDESEAAAALWSFQNQKTVGFGTDTLPNAKARYVPLTTVRGPVGVIALWADSARVELTMEQERLLQAYADLEALAIEGIELAEEASKSRVLQETEKLQTALLNSVSHDLRTPLVSIIGVLSSLQEEGLRLDDDAKRNLVQVARDEAERLNHFIANLLDMSRIEAGAIKLSVQSSDIADLVGAALEQLGGRSAANPVNIDIPADLPPVSVDVGLVVEALANILDNAFKYSPAGVPIDISARLSDHGVEVAVADRGSGIPPDDLTRVFDKFYRVQRPDNVSGTGLGLSICKGIVEAHGGRIEAENRPGGGTIIRLNLPVAGPGAATAEASG